MNGLRVLNTRPVKQNQKLEQAIQQAGGISVNLPALAIKATATTWLDNMPTLALIDQAIFTSPNAVDFYFSALQAKNMIWPSTIQVIAVGHATKNALVELNVTVQYLPEIADSEHVIELKTLQSIKGQNILLVRGVGGRTIISDMLKMRKANLISLEVYERGLPDIPSEYVNSVWQDDAVDIILFTSQLAIENLIAMFSEAGRQWICNKPCVVISSRLATVAASLGIKTIIVSRYDTILESLQAYYQGVMHDNAR